MTCRLEIATSENGGTWRTWTALPRCGDCAQAREGHDPDACRERRRLQVLGEIVAAAAELVRRF